MRLVDIDQARMHCRTDSDDDAILSLYVGAAEAAVQEFLNRRVFVDAEDLADAVLGGEIVVAPVLVNDAIRAAVLLIAGHLYRNREQVQTGQGANAVEIPMGAHSLLWPYRVGIGI